jgi:small multidrug resistance pump
LSYLYLLAAIVSEVIGTTFLKESDGFTRLGPGTVTVVTYMLAFYFLSMTLKTIPTGIAYAIWSGVGMVLITAVAWLFHGQRLDPPAMVGMGLIVAGVAIINLFSNAAAH